MVFLFTPGGIVVGADGKLNYLKRNPGSGVGQKIVTLQNRIALACWDLRNFFVLDIGSTKKGKIDTFPQWVAAEIAPFLPNGASVSKAGDVVRRQATLTFPAYNALMRTGMIHREDFPNSKLQQLFVAGMRMVEPVFWSMTSRLTGTNKR